jgi:hypothetical protein
MKPPSENEQRGKTAMREEQKPAVSPERTGLLKSGLFKRLGAESLLGWLGFGLLLAAGGLVGTRRGWSAGWPEFLSVISVFALAHWLAVIFHYVPAGPEHGLSRLSLAAFCRTFVPLLALLAIHNYIFPLLNQTNAGSIIAAYLLSLGLTLATAGGELKA